MTTPADWASDRKAVADDLQRSIALLQVELAPARFQDEEVRVGYMQHVQRAMEVHASLRELTSEEAVVRGSQALRDLGKFVATVPATLRGKEADQEYITRWVSIAGRLELEVRGWSRVEHLIFLQRAAEVALRKAEGAAEESERAAGKSGNASLEMAFDTYATKERKTANRFRVATIIVLSAVIALASGALLESLLASKATSPAWQEVVYRIAILTAFAALAAYLGRQSGHHRRSSVWAEAVAVQLRSFPSFIKPIENGKLSDAIYETFGKRVLAAPPDFIGHANEPVNPAIAMLVDALLKQSKS